MDEKIELTLDGGSLPDEVYEDYDLTGIDELIEELDEDETFMSVSDSEYGESTVRYLIGCSSAEQAWGIIEKDIRSYPLCQNAKVRLLAEDDTVLRELTIPMISS